MLDKYPEESYATVALAVQLEWIILQRVKNDTVQAFTGMGKALWENFLPCLFFGKSKTLPQIIGYLSTFLVKKSVLGLQNSVKSEKDKYNSLLCPSG